MGILLFLTGSLLNLPLPDEFIRLLLGISDNVGTYVFADLKLVE